MINVREGITRPIMIIALSCASFVFPCLGMIYLCVRLSSVDLPTTSTVRGRTMERVTMLFCSWAPVPRVPWQNSCPHLSSTGRRLFLVSRGLRTIRESAVGLSAGLQR